MQKIESKSTEIYGIKTVEIERPIECECGLFSTTHGAEMLKHFREAHTYPLMDEWASQSYSLSWAVGGNAYDWTHRGKQSLDAEYLRKCQRCKTPYIAYDRLDHCDECRKTPEVAALPKYARVNQSLVVL